MARCGPPAGPRDDRREQASLLLGLDFKRLLQHRRAGAVGAAVGKDDGLRRARLQYRRGVGPARLNDRVGAGGAQSFHDVAGGLVGNDGEGTLQRHVGLLGSSIGAFDGARAQTVAETTADPAKVLLTSRQFHPPAARVLSAVVKRHCRA